MKRDTGVQKLAYGLKLLVTAAFACNLAALFLVPGLALLRGQGGSGVLTPYDNPLELPARLAVAFALCWRWVWLEGGYSAVLAVFLLFSGGCTAVILWQARLVLDTIVRRRPFCQANGRYMRRAAACCFLIAAAALARLCWGFWYYRSVAPLLTYNALFFPLFGMAGLLCLVMSALFCQAAELKAENDLTI